MHVRHKITKKEQFLKPEEWEKLQTEGYAKNFDVLQAGEFTPPELNESVGGDTPKEGKKK